MWKKILIGLLAGIISGLFSTGGGMILVPALVYLMDLKIQKLEEQQFCVYYQWL